MKRALYLLLVCTLLLSLVAPTFAEPGIQNGDSLVMVYPSGGPYIIVTNLEPGDLDFNYGWNNAKQFENPALGYWIGVYDITESHYLWVVEEQFSDPNPKMLKMQSFDTELIPGHEYYINFFIRDSYSPDVTNVAELIMYFVAPMIE